MMKQKNREKAKMEKFYKAEEAKRIIDAEEEELYRENVKKTLGSVRQKLFLTNEHVKSFNSKMKLCEVNEVRGRQIQDKERVKFLNKEAKRKELQDVEALSNENQNDAKTLDSTEIAIFDLFEVINLYKYDIHFQDRAGEKYQISGYNHHEIDPVINAFCHHRDNLRNEIKDIKPLLLKSVDNTKGGDRFG